MPNTDSKEKNGFNLGAFLKNVGVFAASATLPGFGQGFAQARAQKLALDQQQRSELFQGLLKSPVTALNRGVQSDIKRLFGNEALQDFVTAGQEAQAQQAIQQLQLSMAQQPGAVPGAVPGEAVSPATGFQQAAQTPQGETTGLVTPAGFGISRQGVRPPIRAGINPGGETQTTLSIGPEGKVRRTIGPVTAEARRLREQDKFREVVRTVEDSLISQGVDPQQARLEAVNQAQRTKGTATPEEFRAAAQIASGTTGQRAFVETAAQRQARLAVPERPPVAINKVFSDIGAVAKNTSKLLDMFESLKNRFGPFKGRREKIVDILGVSSPEIRRFRRLRNIVIDDIARARSGAAIQNLEFGRLDKFLPDLQDTPENFVAGLQAFLDNFQSKITTNRKILESTNVLVPDVKIPDNLQTLLGAKSAQTGPQTDAEAEAEAAAFLNSIGVTPTGGTPDGAGGVQ